MAERFPSVDHWMIGRGLIADPFLPSMIKNNTTTYPENWLEIFSKFHDTLFSEFEEKLKGDKQVIMKMLSFWRYFSILFSDPARIVKKIKKVKTIVAYDDVVFDVFENERALV